MVSTREAAASTMQTMRAEKPTPGHRVATECFPWLRSRSLSHTAMLMQLSEQRVAKSNAANVTVDLPVIDIASENFGARTSSVPAANKNPTVISLRGIVSHSGLHATLNVRYRHSAVPR